MFYPILWYNLKIKHLWALECHIVSYRAATFQRPMNPLPENMKEGGLCWTHPNFRPWSSGLTWRKQPLSFTSLTIPAISAYLFKGLSSIAALTKACRTPLTYQSTRLCPVTRRKSYLRYIRRQISSCHWAASTSFSSLHATAPSRAREQAC